MFDYSEDYAWEASIDREETDEMDARQVYSERWSEQWEEEPPSTNKKDLWIRFGNSNGYNPRYVGKWMIFAAPNEIDAIWEKIKKAYKDKLLGIACKVSTALDLRNNQHVICVYTKDFRSTEDVGRVRGNLRRIGFTQKLCYKTDEQTRRGEKSLYYE